MSLINNIFLSVFLFLNPLIKSKAFNTIEATNIVASFRIQKDSILEFEYEKLVLKFKAEKFNEVLNSGLNLIEKVKKNGNQNLENKLYYLLGQVFEKTRNNKRAINYFKKVKSSPELLENLNVESTEFRIENTESIYAETLLKIGSNYHILKEKTGLSKYRDSTIYNYYKIIDYPSNTNDDLKVKAKTYINLSAIFLNDSSYIEARNYALKAVEINHDLGEKVSEAAALGNLASIHLVEDDFRGAEEIYLRALGLLKYYNSNIAKRYKEDLYYNYAYALYKLKDYKAYDYQELSYNIKDELRKISDVKKIEEVYTKFNIEKVKKEEALKRAESEKKLWLIGLSSTILIIALAFIAGFYRLRQKNLALKLSQNELLQEQKIEKLKLLSQRRILNATIDGKEAERKEIAETLHDSVSALLSSANLHLQATKNKFNGVTPVEVEKSQNIIIEASNKIRNLSHNLVSSVLLKFGIKYAINDLVSKYSNSNISFSASVEDLPRFNQSFEIKVHNIIQELVNNILKHSEATEASIEVEDKEDWLHIVISDNGVGFKMKELDTKDGLGINQIEARIQMMNGKFSVSSVLKKGTTITIEIPMTSAKITTHV